MSLSENIRRMVELKDQRIEELEGALRTAKACVDRENKNSKYQNTALIIDRALGIKKP